MLAWRKPIKTTHGYFAIKKHTYGDLTNRQLSRNHRPLRLIAMRDSRDMIDNFHLSQDSEDNYLHSGFRNLTRGFYSFTVRSNVHDTPRAPMNIKYHRIRRRNCRSTMPSTPSVDKCDIEIAQRIRGRIAKNKKSIIEIA